jgi:CIC family chloride channel protein
MASPLGDRLVFFLLAAAIGAIVGIATLGLVELILWVQYIGFQERSEAHYADAVARAPAWQVVLVPTVGGLLVGLLLQFLPGKRYHGIADVMEACALNGARMPARSGVAAALAAGVSLGVGAPLGREGPAVHIGASISAWLGERLGLDHRQSLALLGCGAAAAVAVSFNAPVAAVIFALEVIVGYYTLRVFAPVVIAVAVAMIVRQHFIGSEPLFPVPDQPLASLWELLIFAMVGVLGAGLAKMLIALVPWVETFWARVLMPHWLRPAGAGLLIGVVAIELPLILSVGFDATFAALSGELGPGLLATLLIAKLVVVALALGSGFAGGIFGPAIYLGAMLGGVTWYVLVWVGTGLGLPLPDALTTQGVYAVVGMAAVSSALLGAPISTILIVFELTRDYGVTLGVMTAAAVASTVMQFGEHGSFFRWQLSRRNVDIRRGRDISLLTLEPCEALVSAQYLRTDSSVTVGELEARMGSERQRVAVFVDDNEVLLGSTSLSDLIVHAIEHGMDSPAIDAAIDASYAIAPTTNIVSAVQLMAEHQVEYVPVVDSDRRTGIRATSRDRIVGVVFKTDLLSAHYDVIKRAREHEFGIT